MKSIPGYFFILFLVFTSVAKAEDEPFSRVIELEPSIQLGPEEIYDSDPFDVRGFRYATILIQKATPEKMPDPNVLPIESEVSFRAETFFYLENAIPREKRKGSKYPLLTLKGFQGGGAEYGIFKNRGMFRVEIWGPYLAVRVKQSGASDAKLRVSVFLRR